jgi:preprotein translocase subunit SecF
MTIRLTHQDTHSKPDEVMTMTSIERWAPRFTTRTIAGAGLLVSIVLGVVCFAVSPINHLAYSLAAFVGSATGTLTAVLLAARLRRSVSSRASASTG